mmetsp:Transcript_15600/g.41885  ORF Transcript_15600/g.41885 Transcript_15600/m.41885 type:complete len:221 (+) Transcript_15600:422-1084(+)
MVFECFDSLGRNERAPVETQLHELACATLDERHEASVGQLAAASEAECDQGGRALRERKHGCVCEKGEPGEVEALRLREAMRRDDDDHFVREVLVVGEGEETQAPAKHLPLLRASVVPSGGARRLVKADRVSPAWGSQKRHETRPGHPREPGEGELLEVAQGAQRGERGVVQRGAVVESQALKRVCARGSQSLGDAPVDLWGVCQLHGAEAGPHEAAEHV